VVLDLPVPPRNEWIDTILDMVYLVRLDFIIARSGSETRASGLMPPGLGPG
jgi:hypothetical protein